MDADSAVYLKSDTPRPVVLFELVKGMVTGTPPNVLGEEHVSGSDIDRGA